MKDLVEVVDKTERFGLFIKDIFHLSADPPKYCQPCFVHKRRAHEAF